MKSIIVGNDEFLSFIFRWVRTQEALQYLDDLERMAAKDPLPNKNAFSRAKRRIVKKAITSAQGMNNEDM